MTAILGAVSLRIKSSTTVLRDGRVGWCPANILPDWLLSALLLCACILVSANRGTGDVSCIYGDTTTKACSWQDKKVQQERNARRSNTCWHGEVALSPAASYFGLISRMNLFESPVSPFAPLKSLWLPVPLLTSRGTGDEDLIRQMSKMSDEQISRTLTLHGKTRYQSSSGST